MGDLTFENFKKLHEAMRVKKRLDSFLEEKEISDDECVEGYMIMEDRCDTGLIELYIADELDKSEAQMLERHLEKCDSCRKMLEDMRELKDAFHKNIAIIEAGKTDNRDHPGIDSDSSEPDRD